MAQPSTSKPDLSVAPVAGQKRKRPTEKKFYAVKVGKEPGVYDTWDQCLAQVTGQKGAVFKSFTSQTDAQAFVAGNFVPQPSKNPGDQKFYAVQHGKTPGVYTDWPSAQAQISGFRNPRHKKFSTRAEAEAFVSEGTRKSAYDRGIGISPEEEIRRLIVKNSAPGMITNGDHLTKDKQGNVYELGRGPLPAGAEDGFDPNIKLESDGTLRHRTGEEKLKTKFVPKDAEPPGMLRIYTDGSSLKNGQPGARAGVGVFFGPQDPKYDAPLSSSQIQSKTEVPLYTIDWRARGAPSKLKRRKLTWRYRNVSEALKGSRQTNQRAELTAIQRALDIAPSHRDVTIYTDSKYAIDCVTNWYKNWMRSGWVNSKGKSVENKDLVQDIRDKLDERDLLGKVTYFVWVKGHAADAGNIAADRLAVEGALKGVAMALEESQSMSGQDTTTGTGDATDDDEENSEDDSMTEDENDMETSLQLRNEALSMDKADSGQP